MKTVGKSKVKVNGVRETEIAGQLEFYYANSNTALKLMNDCGARGLNLKVQATGGTCICTSAKEVDLFWDVCHNNVKEISESALFEMNNSLNYDKKKGIDRKLAFNSLSLLEYGYEFAVHESPSTTLVHKVLTELASKYRPSTWGLKQKMTQQAATNMGIGIKRVFANAKQDADATTGKKSLKSKYLYAYEKFGEKKVGTSLQSAKAKLKKITSRFETAGTPAKTVVMHEPTFTNLITQWNTRYSCGNMDNLRAFFAAYIFALKTLKESGWKITWNQGANGKWIELAQAIARVDSHDPSSAASAIAQDLRTAYPG
jgi:hypothetical protein